MKSAVLVSFCFIFASQSSFKDPKYMVETLSNAGFHQYSEFCYCYDWQIQIITCATGVVHIDYMTLSYF